MPVFFGDKIRFARKNAGLTQRQLAGMIGATNTTVSNWEKGLSRPDADMIQKLCDALHLQPNYFYGADSESHRTVSDEDIKFALFGGNDEITDEMFDEVKRFAAFVKQRRNQSKE